MLLLRPASLSNSGVCCLFLVLEVYVPLKTLLYSGTAMRVNPYMNDDWTNELGPEGGALFAGALTALTGLQTLSMG